jgi:hypothetical protein
VFSSDSSFESEEESTGACILEQKSVPEIRGLTFSLPQEIKIEKVMKQITLIRDVIFINNLFK